MALTPDRIVALQRAAEALSMAPHGEKGPVAEAQARLLGCTVATLYRQIDEAGFAQPRKRRADAGRCCISREEAMNVAALKVIAQRANGKDNLAIGNATSLARANGLAALGRLDRDSGELVPVSDSTVARALRQHRLDLKTVRRPAPHRGARSLHPNHVWQIDASVCVLYYLDSGGLGVIEHDEFYKNKPENFTKKAKALVIRYVCTDHFTGTVHFRYYLGAESGEMLCEFFIDCISPKGHEKEPFHGVPMLVVLDPGSANKGALFRNLCRLLGVKMIVHQPKNPRAKGSVEKHNDLIERGFEATLIGITVSSLEQLNAEASLWRRNFNGVKKHSRHGHTRYGFWQTIRQEHLRVAPPPDVCRSLMSGKTTEREVRGDLTVSFEGDSYSVREVPHLNIGQKVMVARSPYREDALLLIEQDAHQRDVHWACPRVELAAGNFRADAPVWGEEFKAFADTPAVQDMKAIERLAYGVDGKLAVDAARRKRQPVFGGLDISSHLEAATPAAYMARPGTAMEVASPLQAGGAADGLGLPATRIVAAEHLNVVQLAGRLHQALPGEWRTGSFRQLTAWYPDGALETEIGEIVDRFRGLAEPPRRFAGGGA